VLIFEKGRGSVICSLIPESNEITRNQSSSKTTREKKEEKKEEAVRTT
jgi:hypothetical protein